MKQTCSLGLTPSQFKTPDPETQDSDTLTPKATDACPEGCRIQNRPVSAATLIERCGVIGVGVRAVPPPSGYLLAGGVRPALLSGELQPFTYLVSLFALYCTFCKVLVFCCHKPHGA